MKSTVGTIVLIVVVGFVLLVLLDVVAQYIVDGIQEKAINEFEAKGKPADLSVIKEISLRYGRINAIIKTCPTIIVIIVSFAIWGRHKRLCKKEDY